MNKYNFIKKDAKRYRNEVITELDFPNLAGISVSIVEEDGVFGFNVADDTSIEYLEEGYDYETYAKAEEAAITWIKENF